MMTPDAAQRFLSAALGPEVDFEVRPQRDGLYDLHVWRSGRREDFFVVVVDEDSDRIEVFGRNWDFTDTLSEVVDYLRFEFSKAPEEAEHQAASRPLFTRLHGWLGRARKRN